MRRASQRPRFAATKFLNCFVSKVIQSTASFVPLDIAVPDKRPELRQFLVGQFRNGSLDFLYRAHIKRLEDRECRASQIEANVEVSRD
jgi:hypothetical protein